MIRFSAKWRAVASPRPDAPPVITARLPWGGSTTLKARFFQDLARSSPADALAGYPGPLQVIVARHDSLIFPQPAAGQLLLDHHDGLRIEQIQERLPAAGSVASNQRSKPEFGGGNQRQRSWAAAAT